MWFEREMISIMVAALGRIRESADTDRLHRFNATYAEAIQSISFVLATDEAVALARAAVPALLAFIQEAPRDDLPSILMQIEIADAAAISCTGMLVGLLRRAREIDPSEVSRLDHYINKSISPSFNSWLPKNARDAVAGVIATRKLEMEVEGTIITPAAYGEELVLASVLRTIGDGLLAACSLFFDLLLPASNALGKAGHYEASTIISQRSYESSAKLETAARELDLLVARVAPQVLLQPQDWPAVDSTALVAQAERIKMESIKGMIKGALKSFRPQFDDEMPDLWGQAYHVAAQETFVAMLSGKQDAIRELAPGFMVLAFACIDRLRSRQSKVDVFATWAGQIALDIFELGGYAIILSGLDSANYWGPYRDALSKVLDHDNNRCKNLGIYLATAQYTNSLLAITTRSILRFNWQTAVRDKLESMGLQEASRFGYPRRFVPPRHRNKTIRVLLRDGEVEDRAFDVFVALYALRHCSELQNIHDGARRLQGELILEGCRRGDRERAREIEAFDEEE